MNLKDLCDEEVEAEVEETEVSDTDAEEDDSSELEEDLSTALEFLGCLLTAWEATIIKPKTRDVIRYPKNLPVLMEEVADFLNDFET